MNINSLSLLYKTVQVTPQVMRMLGGLLEREVTRDDHEWTSAVASLTIREKVKIMPSRRQHEENERDCRTIVQQLVSSIPHEVLTSTYYRRKEQGSSTRRKTVTFVDQDKEGEKVEQNLLQDCFSGESEIDEKVPDEIFFPAISAWILALRIFSSTSCLLFIGITMYLSELDVLDTSTSSSCCLLPIPLAPREICYSHSDKVSFSITFVASSSACVFATGAIHLPRAPGF